MLTDDEQVEDLTQPVNEAQKQLESLHRRWSKITKTPGSENVRMKACKEAEKSSKFIRIVQRRDLPWEKDSIARAAYDPEHIPDCNVQATIGKHFLFHGVIPKAANGLGYLRVTTKSLWWQYEHFPSVWTLHDIAVSDVQPISKQTVLPMLARISAAMMSPKF